MVWLFAFQLALISLGNVYIQLFSFQIWKIVGQNELFNLGTGSSQGEGKLNLNLLNMTKKTDFVSYPACVVGLDKYKQFGRFPILFHQRDQILIGSLTCHMIAHGDDRNKINTILPFWINSI